MQKHILTFSECEHYGDLDNYVDDIVACGGTIESKRLNYDEEVGVIECSVPHDFWMKFKTTNSYEFLN